MHNDVGERKRAITWYLAIAYTLAWLVCLPLYLSGQGLAHGFFTPIALAMMTTPMVAALVVTLWIERRPLTRTTGESVWDTLGISIRRPYGPLVGYFVLAWLAMIVLVVVALGTSALCGTYQFDLANLSGMREVLVQQYHVSGAQLPDGASFHNVAFAQVIAVIFFAVLNLIPALGEEIGWRGFLMPRLAAFSPAVALLGGGVAWGLWHLPLLALGYNYPHANLVVSAGAMVGMCTLIGALLYWVRLRSNSVWPAAIGHGALNAGAGLTYIFARAPIAQINTTTATILGVCGWIVPALLVGLLWVRNEFQPQNAGDLNDG